MQPLHHILHSFILCFALIKRAKLLFLNYHPPTTLELSVLWSTWEWDYVADVLYTCYEENQTLEAETETCVWA